MGTIPINISGKLLFARFFNFEDYREPILIRYIYDKLRKFCTSCGSLTHLAANCSSQAQEAEPLPLPAPPSASNQDRRLEPEQHTPTEDADDTMGETIGSNINMDTSENPLPAGSQGDLMDFLHHSEFQAGINQTLTIREVGSTSVSPRERGTKRKIDATLADDGTSFVRRRTNDPI